MEYRKLGCHGLKVSQFSLGSWVTFGRQMDLKPIKEMLKHALDLGVNFFDNAEAYADGQSEELMGKAFKQLEVPRHYYILSTKFFWGIEPQVNFQNTLNRKYLLHAITGSLKRLGTDYVDIVYCHRPDPDTPIEETVMAMHDMIQRGYALYWGTSEWGADELEQAYDFAVTNGFHRPIVEQPQYNMVHRKKVESEFNPLYDKIGLGLTTWSPLASGLLTGKYLNGIPENSRLNLPTFERFQVALEDRTTQKIIQDLKKLSDESKLSMAHLALGWCTLNPNVSTVILGASRLEQLKENLKTIALLPQIRDLKIELDRIASQSAE